MFNATGKLHLAKIKFKMMNFQFFNCNKLRKKFFFYLKQELFSGVLHSTRPFFIILPEIIVSLVKI